MTREERAAARARSVDRGGDAATTRPTPERIAEIRARLDGQAYGWLATGDVEDLLAEVDAVTAERDEARGVLADLYALAVEALRTDRVDRTGSIRIVGMQALHRAVLERYRPKEES